MPETPRKALIRGDAEPQLRLTDARTRVLKLMSDGLARTPAEIAELAGVSPGVVTGLGQARALRWVELPEFARAPEPDPDGSPATLTPDQLRAGEHLRDAVKKREFSVALLDGVTGSGKTEAYFEGIAQALLAGAPGSDPAARNRAHRAVSRSLRRPLRLPAARMALGSLGSRTPPRLSRGPFRRGARRGRRALRAVPSLCTSSASSSSMRSTSRPTSRKKASSITPATWPLSARGWRTAPSCSRRRRRRSKPTSTPEAASTNGSSSPTATARRTCRRSGSSTCARTQASRASSSRPRCARH